MKNEKKTLSISDIARLAGVSVATVSHVINNTGRFSAKTAEKVNAVIEKYGYISNNAARSLKLATSRSVGLIVPNLINEFFSTIAVSIEQFFDSIDYSLFICNTDNDPEKELRYFKRLEKMQVDGIIVISCMDMIDSTILTRNIPIVLLDRNPINKMDLPLVSTDAAEGIYKATVSLLNKGCRNLVFISSFLSTYVASNRYTGFIKALQERGFNDGEERIIRLHRGSSLITAETQIVEYLEQGNKVDGVICTSDNQAIAVMAGLKRCGLRVPEDVKVFGFDNQLQSRICTPTLSTIERNPSLMGKIAAECLLHLLNGEDDQVPQHTQIDCSLVERESTAIH